MGKINPATDLENYSSNNTSYFSLKDDKDTAMVRFMYNSINDVEAFAVHKVKVNGFDRYVNCLREYTDPLDKCPLCESGHRVIARLFLPLYKIDTGETMLWDRSSKFYNTMTDLCAKCNPLVSFPIEIERNGAKGDMNTFYEFYPEPSDGTLIEDLPEPPNPIGTIILDKTYDELMTYVQTGSFDTGESNPMNSTSSYNSSNGEVRRRRDVSANSTLPRRRSTSGNTPL